jgi:ABC-2 type transport system permease protein
MKQIKNITKVNNLRALLALTKISFLRSLRNPSSLFFNFFFPFIFIALFGVLGEGSKTYTIGIRPSSVKTGPVYETLKTINVFKLDTEFTDAQLDDKLKKGQIPVALTIKENGEIQVAPNVKMPKYDLLIETSKGSPMDVGVISPILEKVVDKINNPEQQNQTKLIEVKQVSVEGRQYKQIDFILPGQLAFALLTNALFGISFTFISMRKELIFKRMFASPINRWIILFAEALAKFITAMLQALIIILVGHFVFGFTLANGITTLLDMVVLSMIGIFVFLALGIITSMLGKTEDAVSPIANLIMMPQLFLSGAFFPIEQFPAFLQTIAKVLPMTFLNEAFKKVAFEGAPLTDTMPQILGLFIWGAILYLIGIKMFKWE